MSKLMRRLTLAIIAIASIGMFYAFTGKSETPVKKAFDNYTYYLAADQGDNPSNFANWGENLPNGVSCGTQGEFCSFSYTTEFDIDPADVLAQIILQYTPGSATGGSFNVTVDSHVIPVTVSERAVQ